MSQSSFNPYGAVDLSSLAPRPAPSAGGAAGDGGSGSATAGTGVVIDVTEADFQTSVIDTSMTVPVVIDFWADWCGPCKQLSPVLERLATAAGGKWVLAKIDLDANPRLGQAFQVQSIPAIFAVVKGQPIPLFQGALPEADVQRYLDELLRVAAENGVNGRVQPAGQRRRTPAMTRPMRRSSEAISTPLPLPTARCSTTRPPIRTHTPGWARWNCCAAPTAWIRLPSARVLPRTPTTLPLRPPRLTSTCWSARSRTPSSD
jgi:thioredoxin